MEYDYLHPNAVASTQQLPSPILTSTPSQLRSPLTPMTSELSGEASRVRTAPTLDDHTLTHSSHISCTSEQSNDQIHLKVHLDERLLPTEKKEAQKALKERNEEGWPSREPQRLATTGQPFRESLQKSAIPKTTRSSSMRSANRYVASCHTSAASQSTHASKLLTDKQTYVVYQAL